ncbi:MAG TPA: MgtC/SapB family protein [Candidatus Polarisedimenticolia bacterium]|nr:MgtC/SapB family protein [Candidatus Polarisedimenticolia bacterium]
MHVLQLLSPTATDFLVNALLAIVCGGLMGAEREMKRKPAGFRTNILICFGSMMFMWLSIQVTLGLGVGQTGDPGRIAAQVVVGIGFLGGGAIIQSRGRVTGLTSAAMIWVVSAVGMAIGAGYRAIGVLATVLILLVLVGLGILEQRVFERCIYSDCVITFDDDKGKTRRAVEQALRGSGRPLESIDLKKSNDHYAVTFQYCDVHPQHKEFLGDLWRIEGVREIRPLR